MKRVAAFVVLAIVLSGCGGGSSSEKVATEASLLNALPTATELPPGWSTSGVGPGVDLLPRTGPGFGPCGGPNTDQRAIDANVVAHAYQTGLLANVGRQFGTAALYAFGNEEDAAAFMASTERAISSCITEEVDVAEFVEGRDEGTTELSVDIFTGDAEPDEPWEMFVRTSLGGAAAEGADEAFHFKATRVYASVDDNIDYGVTKGGLSQYERHGTVVLIFSLRGECCLFGFFNTDSRDEEKLPQYPALQAAADHLRPGILAQLFNNTDT